MSAHRSSDIHLRRTDENVAAIEAAAARAGARVGMAGVLARLDRSAVRTAVPGTGVEWGFRWDDRDEVTETWWPQGITTSADATDSEEIGGRRLVVTSWYHQPAAGAHRGSRITVVDLDTLEYRHVLLVVPRSHRGGHVELRPLRVHAGGLVWCGPYLHVAGTRRGLVSCRVDDILRLERPEDAFGYQYVLPVRFGYDAASRRGVEPMRYSFLSLARSSGSPQLLAGEYATDDMTRRLVRFPLDPDTLHLATEEDGTTRPVWLDARGQGHMQGAAMVGDTYYVTSSRGRHRRGQLYVGQPGRFRRFPRALPPGPEDICYWPSTDRLWSLSEHPGRRFVFALERSRFAA